MWRKGTKKIRKTLRIYVVEHGLACEKEGYVGCLANTALCR